MTVSSQTVASCGVVALTTVALSVAAKMASRAVIPCAVLASLQVSVVEFIVKRLLSPVLKNGNQKLIAESVAHLVIGSALYFGAVKVGLIATAILPAIAFVALTGTLAIALSQYKWEEALLFKRLSVLSMEAARNRITQPDMESSLTELIAFLEDKPLLANFKLFAWAIQKWHTLNRSANWVVNRELSFPTCQDGFRWAIYGPSHHVGLGKPSEHYLGRLREMGADVVINFASTNETPSNREIISGVCQYRHENMFILHPVNSSEEPTSNLEDMARASLQPIKALHDRLIILAAQKGCKIEELKIVVHSQDDLHLTPFYMALMALFHNPDYINGSNWKIICNFMQLIGYYKDLNHFVTPSMNRLPSLAMVSAFCRPEFIKILTEIASGSPAKP